MRYLRIVSQSQDAPGNLYKDSIAAHSKVLCQDPDVS